MVLKWNGIEIDEKMAMVLDSIRQQNGSATTSDVKSDTQFEHNNSVKYRFRKLESAGIVKIEDQGIDPDTGRRLPLRVELTGDGRELITEYDIHQESVREQQSIENRVEILEAKMDKVRDDLWQMKNDMQNLREDVNRIMDALDLSSPDEGENVEVAVNADELNFGD